MDEELTVIRGWQEIEGRLKKPEQGVYFGTWLA